MATHDQRVKRYHQRNAKKGLKQTKVWVPEKRVKELQAIAQKMREEEETKR